MSIEIGSPFISNDYCDVGGAGEGDVVDGVDHLREEQGVHLTLQAQGPVKN